MLADVARHPCIPVVTLVVAVLLTACERPPADTQTTAAPSPTTAEVAPSPDPEADSDVLTSAEKALADPRTPDSERNRWAWAQQEAYRDLAAHPARQDEARRRMPKHLRQAFDLNLRATRELRLLTSPRPKPPSDWRIVAPPSVDALRGYYREAESRFGVPWSVLAAVHFVETRFGRIRGDSHAGAQGPMQFMPRTWDAYGKGDIQDPRDAILAAARYLAASGAPDDLRRALFAYNRSHRYVEAILAHATVMRRYDHYLDTYHRWRVYYRTVDGDVVLEEGYGS